jgi:hypothetical protein
MTKSLSSTLPLLYLGLPEIVMQSKRVNLVLIVDLKTTVRLDSKIETPERACWNGGTKVLLLWACTQGFRQHIHLLQEEM